MIRWLSDRVAIQGSVLGVSTPVAAVVKRGRLGEPFIWDSVMSLERYRTLLLADSFAPSVAWPEPTVALDGDPESGGRRIAQRIARLAAGEERYPFELRGGRAAARVRSAIASHRPDVLHAHYGQTAVWALRTLRRRPPLVVTFYCHDLFALGKYPYWQAAYRRVFEEASLTLVLSNYIREFALELGAPAEKLEIDRQAIDLDAFAFRDPIPNGEPVVLCVSHFQPKKGIVYLVRAFAALRTSHPHAKLRLLGSGEQEARVRAEIDALGIADRVEFLAPVPYEELPAVFAAADVFVLPSVMSTDFDIDEISMVIVEAMATGLPVVTTHHAGIAEIVRDGENGFLAEERDVDSLADALDRLLADPSSWAPLARAARATVERHFDRKRQGPVLEARYDAVSGR